MRDRTVNHHSKIVRQVEASRATHHMLMPSSTVVEFSDGLLTTIT